MIVSIETMVGLGLHVLSDHFRDIILLHLQVLHVLTLYYIPYNGKVWQGGGSLVNLMNRP